MGFLRTLDRNLKISYSFLEFKKKIKIKKWKILLHCLRKRQRSTFGGVSEEIKSSEHLKNFVSELILLKFLEEFSVILFWKAFKDILDVL